MPSIKLTKDLLGIADDCRPPTALKISDIATKMTNIAILLSTALDIIDEELMPNIATMAIQDFGRLNEFLMNAQQIKEELKEND